MDLPLSAALYIDYLSPHPARFQHLSHDLRRLCRLWKPQKLGGGKANALQQTGMLSRTAKQFSSCLLIAGWSVSFSLSLSYKMLKSIRNVKTNK